MFSPYIRRYLYLVITTILGICSVTFLALLTMDVFDIGASFDLNDSITGAHDFVRITFPATTTLIFGVVALVVVLGIFSCWINNRLQWRRSPSVSSKTAGITRIDSMQDLEEGKSESLELER
jgi:type VI protein secretion system component VasK